MASRRWTSSNCSPGGCSESWAPKPIMPSPRERVPHAAVHGQRAAGGLRGPVRGEEEHGLRDIFGTNTDAQQVAPAVEVLELVHADPLGRRTLASDVVRPQFRVLKHGIRVHDIRAYSVGRAFQSQDLGEL